MKKVADFVQYVSFDGGKTFQDTSIWRHICYVEPTEDKVVVVETFEQAYEYIKADKLMNAKIDTTFFINLLIKKGIFLYFLNALVS